MIAFIDTEMSIGNSSIANYSAVRDNSIELYSCNAAKYSSFVSEFNTWCGHNILRKHLKYIYQQIKY